jgi:1-acyl-sn-glycerol-3-phosphate acyltransferase
MHLYPPVAYAVIKFVSWSFLRIKYDLKVSGQQNVPMRGPVILACNHVSHLDPVVLGVASPRRVTYMARHTLWSGFWMRFFMDTTECIPLRRGESDVWAIRESARRLKKGITLGLFPEGTRQTDGRLGQAKRGIGFLASLARTNVVPVAIKGTYEALPKGAKRLQPSKIRVAFGTPIAYTTAASREGVTPGAVSDGGAISGPSRQAEGKPERRVSAEQHDQLAEAVTRQWQQLLASLKESS